jgi:hypothetical protein
VLTPGRCRQPPGIQDKESPGIQDKMGLQVVKKDIEKQRKWLKQQRAKLPPPPKKPKAAPVPRKRGEDPLIVRARFVCSCVCRPAVPA